MFSKFKSRLVFGCSSKDYYGNYSKISLAVSSLKPLQQKENIPNRLTPPKMS